MVRAVECVTCSVVACARHGTAVPGTAESRLVSCPRRAPLVRRIACVCAPRGSRAAGRTPGHRLRCLAADKRWLLICVHS